MMNPNPTLTTARLRLRRPYAEDLSAYRAHYTSDRSVFQGGPYSTQQCFERLAAMIGHWELRGFGRYVIELDGQGIGHVGPLQIDDASAPELTWSLWHQDFEGNGYASEGADAVAQHLLKDCGWSRLVVLIQPENVRSMRVAERLGARLTGERAPDWYAGAKVYQLGGMVA